jgi:phage terminase small subunit
MSVASVNKEAQRLLVHPRITPLLDELREGLAQAHAITADHVISELTAIACSDLRKAMRWGHYETADPAKDGQRPQTRNYFVVMNSTEIDDDIAAAIAEVSKNRYGIKIRLYAKLAALDKLAKMLGLYEDENNTKNANVVVEIHPLKVQPRPRSTGDSSG